MNLHNFSKIVSREFPLVGRRLASFGRPDGAEVLTALPGNRLDCAVALQERRASL